MLLNLKLRDEFLGSQMPGTAIALRRKDNTGAAQRTPDFILSIERNEKPRFPTRTVANPERRQERLAEQLADTPEYERSGPNGVSDM